MRNNIFKKNNGISLIKAILLILFTILVVFLLYEIFYEEIQKSEQVNMIYISTNKLDEERKK